MAFVDTHSRRRKYRRSESAVRYGTDELMLLNKIEDPEHKPTADISEKSVYQSEIAAVMIHYRYHYQRKIYQYRISHSSEKIPFQDVVLFFIHIYTNLKLLSSSRYQSGNAVVFSILSDIPSRFTLFEPAKLSATGAKLAPRIRCSKDAGTGTCVER